MVSLLEDLQKILASQGKNQRASDERIRNSIEGKVGEAQRRFSLGRVMAKLSREPHRMNDPIITERSFQCAAYLMSIKSLMKLTLARQISPHQNS